MSLKNTIQEDIKTAMKARESDKLAALRLLHAAIKQREIDEQIQMDDAAVIATIEKQNKQRRDAAAQYDAANRPELAERERFEMTVMSVYLPAALSASELEQIITAAIAETGAAGIGDMGKVMNLIKPRIAGQADMAEVSRTIRTRLSA